MSASLSDFHLTATPLFYLAMILFIAGLQFLSTGLLAELVVANAADKQTPYSIRQILNGPSEDQAVGPN